MPESKINNLNRRDFMKSAALLVGGFIGTLVAAPAIAYLISPARRQNEEAVWIDLGLLDKYPPACRPFVNSRGRG